jgi:hypothetical protein
MIRARAFLLSSPFAALVLPIACGSSAPDLSAGNLDGSVPLSAEAAVAPAADSSLDAAALAPDSAVLLGDAGVAPDGANLDAGALDAGALDAGPDIDAASKGDPYNCAPAARTLSPVAVFATSGTVTNPTSILTGQPTSLVGSGSYIVLDFGTEVGGLISLSFSAASDANQSVGIAFSESSLYVGPSSDQSNGSGTPDGAISVPVAGASTYTVPPALLRGGFRYLTLFLSSSGSVDVSAVSLAYSPDPNRTVPNQYPNYFYSNDDALNKAWYAGAYTFQTNIALNGQGRSWPPVSTNWNNANTIGESGSVVLTDGAKRDRTVWPGDMGISIPTGYAALFDTVSGKNSLQTLFNHEDGAGQLPYAGPPMNFGGSDTYHMWTLVGTCLYYLYSGDKAWLDGVWPKFKLGMTFITNKIDANGLLSVTGTNDWARDGQGGENIEANAILYALLTRAASLAQIEGDATLAAGYATQASTLKAQVNATLWDSSVGAFKDNPTSTLYPQDGNALAAWFGLAATPTQAKGLSYVLNENWNALGSRGPEFTIGSGTPKISPFAGSMELMGHFTLGYDTRALGLIRRTWGFMLTSPTGTGCTFWEGFNSDGSFAYSDLATSFTSLSHGWSTGPTSALTFYVLGVAPDTAVGQTYHVVPHPGDLTHVEGKLTMAAGKVVSVNYDVGTACHTFSLRVDAQTNAGSLGTIGIPRLGATHAIQIDGVTAWDGASFVPTAGIASANEDADYVYFTGVEPAVHTFAFSDGVQCPAPPEEWTFCADENGTCAFTGTKRVRFGKQGKYDYGIFTGGTPCNLATFGPDPAPNIAKSCQVSDDLYTLCAAEGGTCTPSATSTEVRFGANGQWVTRSVTGASATPCDVATFGDPIANVVKRCEYR